MLRVRISSLVPDKHKYVNNREQLQMTTYIKTTIVWDKDSILNMSPEAGLALETKKDEMISAGTMHEQQGYADGPDTATNYNRFTTRVAAEEWVTFIDTVAASNNLVKISSRITDVTHSN